jgi:hypothetical protein
MAEHMRVDFELNIGRHASTLDQLLQTANRKRRSAFGDKDEGRLGRAF